MCAARSPVLLASALLLLCAVPTRLAAQDAPPLPLTLTDEEWGPLRAHRDSSLERALHARLNANRKWRALLASQKMGLAIVDLSDPAAPRYAHANGNVMMYAASLPKIAILLAAMQAIEDGDLEPTDVVMKDLNDMIRVSSNRAATRAIGYAGGLDRVNAVLTDPRYALYDPAYGGGLWVGKAYASSNRRRPDPLKGISHAATASQVARFYYLVATGHLVSPARSAQMLEMLSSPGINHKFVNTLSQVAPEADLYRKSGSWRDWHSDSALVWGPEWRRYIVVCLVRDEGGERVMRNVVRAIEELLHPDASTGTD